MIYRKPCFEVKVKLKDEQIRRRCLRTKRSGKIELEVVD